MATLIAGTQSSIDAISVYTQNLAGLITAACFTGSPVFDPTSFMYSVSVTKR